MGPIYGNVRQRSTVTIIMLSVPVECSQLASNETELTYEHDLLRTMSGPSTCPACNTMKASGKYLRGRRSLSPLDHEGPLLQVGHTLRPLSMHPRHRTNLSHSWEPEEPAMPPVVVPNLLIFTFTSPAMISVMHDTSLLRMLLPDHELPSAMSTRGHGQ